MIEIYKIALCIVSVWIIIAALIFLGGMIIILKEAIIEIKWERDCRRRYEKQKKEKSDGMG